MNFSDFKIIRTTCREHFAGRRYSLFPIRFTRNGQRLGLTGERVRFFAARSSELEYFAFRVDASRTPLTGRTHHNIGTRTRSHQWFSYVSRFHDVLLYLFFFFLYVLSERCATRLISNLKLLVKVKRVHGNIFIEQ